MRVCEIHAVDAAAQYRQLLQLGREEFLASAAPAALVRFRTADSAPPRRASTAPVGSMDDEIIETLPHSALLPADVELQVFPLTKKPGAAFADRITIGRTANNDVVIDDTSVSRLHAYVRRLADGWVIADAGSKNGSRLRGVALEPRREQPLRSRELVRLGEVDLTFYTSVDLYDALGGTA